MRDVSLLWVDARLNKSTKSALYQIQAMGQWHICENVAYANTMIKKLRPEVIVFDFDYADMNGLKVLRQIRQVFPSIPLFMLTEQHYEDLSIWALRCHIWDYLVKPLDIDYFVQQLEMAMTEINDKETESRWISVLPSNYIPREASFIDENSMGLGAHIAMSYLKSHLDEKISAHDIAQLCGLTRYELSRAFKAEYGMTFRDSLVKLRMQRAARILSCTHMCITDVALNVGYNDLSHFSRLFHRYFDCSPSDYRNENYVKNNGANVYIHNFDRRKKSYSANVLIHNFDEKRS